jgi:hypothetical protein
MPAKRPTGTPKESNNLAPLLLTCATWRVTIQMIRTIRHKGLKRLFEDNDPSGVNREHADKLRDILSTLHAAPTVAHLDLPGFRLHPLKKPDERLLGRDRSGKLARDFPF